MIKKLIKNVIYDGGRKDEIRNRRRAGAFRPRTERWLAVAHCKRDGADRRPCDTAEAADGGGRAERSRRKITGSFLIRVYWNIRTKGLY